MKSLARNLIMTFVIIALAPLALLVAVYTVWIPE